jgi:hypothetical protein
MRGVSKYGRAAAAKPGKLRPKVDRMNLASGVLIQIVLVKRGFRIYSVGGWAQVSPCQSIVQRRSGGRQGNERTENRTESDSRDPRITCVVNFADTPCEAGDGLIRELIRILFSGAGLGLKELQVAGLRRDQPSVGCVGGSLGRAGAGVEADKNGLFDQSAGKLVDRRGP